MKWAVETFSKVQKNATDIFTSVDSRESTIGEFSKSSDTRMTRTETRLKIVKKIVLLKMRVKLRVDVKFDYFAENTGN